MTRVTMKVTLRVQGPILTQASSLGEPGVDAAMAKRKFGGTERFYLPGRLVKGLLREAWHELSFPGINEWLGEESRRRPEDQAGDEPERGRFSFSDFADEVTDAGEHELRYRIAIEEVRGAANAGAMQVIDSPYAPFQEVAFRGEVRFYLRPGEDAGGIARELLRGLSWVRAVGSTRTSGFGELLGVEVADPVSATHSQAAAAPAGTRWELRFTFAEPVILSRRRIADNLFESGEQIPGGAIKGAIAEMIKSDPVSFATLNKELDLVGFSHAFPASALPNKPAAARPTHWPLSLTIFPKGAEGGRVADAIQQPADPDGQVPLRPDSGGASLLGAFDIDWKDDEAGIVSRGYGWPEIKRQLRVRTAIESADRKAKEHALFAWQMIEPDGLEWVGRVETASLSDAARAQLGQLLQFGVEPLGKTRALAAVRLVAAGIPKAAAAKVWAITLQTPALLINPGLLVSHDGTGSMEEKVLREEFERVWSDRSGGALKLVNYYQRCSLAGGLYHYRRFFRPGASYKPWLLSDAGSVFRFTAEPGREADASRLLDSWLRTGLPLRPDLIDFYDIPPDPRQYWRYCPYLPENGYGEITVNQALPAIDLDAPGREEK